MRNACVRHEELKWCDEPGRLVVDLRKEGVPYIPVASRRTGKIRTSPPDMHVHPGLVEICYCVRGSLAFETPEREYSFLPGTVFTSRPDEPHRMKSNPKGLFVYRILVEVPPRGECFDVMDEKDSAYLAKSIIELPRRFVANTPALRKAFDALFVAYEAKEMPAPRRRMELKSRSLDISLACIDAASHSTVLRSNPAVRDCLQLMETSPQDEYDIDDMAKRAGMSRGNFIRAFKEASGLPPVAFLRSQRIRLAAKMLEKGTSVAAVALKLKFCSAQYFATVFKAETGISPKAYSKNLKSPKS